MAVKYHCKIFYQHVAKSYDNCDVWVHGECNKINKQTNFTKRVTTPNGIVLHLYTKYFLPFLKLNNDKKFIYTING